MHATRIGLIHASATSRAVPWTATSRVSPVKQTTCRFATLMLGLCCKVGRPAEAEDTPGETRLSG